jgi:exo-beta-1,3-glucanase (GH17 family)
MYRWQSIVFLLVALPLLALLWERPDSRTVLLDSPLFVPPAVAYQPRGFSPGYEFAILSREQIVEDLRLLRKNGFRSLVTYGASGVLGVIPEIARQEGFDGIVIMGLWDLFSEEEWNNTLAQAPYVDGYCLGNEGLGVRYSPDELASKMSELRRLTGRPVTTSEPIDSYLEGPHRDWLLAHSDWLFPNAHPLWAKQFDPNQAANWIIARYDYLVATTGSRVILKEASFPTAGLDGQSEEAQLAFFVALESTGLSFFYFEAFDQPWKTDVLKQPEVEAHWGLYRADGTPKKVILWLSNHWSER